MESVETLNELSEFFKIFSDSTRLKILSVLLKGRTCVNDICIEVGASQSAVSHQLKNLRASNLVNCEKVGQAIYYSIADNHIKVIMEYGLEHIKEGIRL